MMEQIREQLARPASLATVGGFRPNDNPLSSWFGRIIVAHRDEIWPANDGVFMMPLCQINLTELPYCPENLSDLSLITIFLNPYELPIDTQNGDHWLLRAYSTLDDLIPIETPAYVNHIKPFPMRWNKVEHDFPCWEDVGSIALPSEVEENYYDFFRNQIGTKIGGWPSIIQGGLDMATTPESIENIKRLDGITAPTEFVFQIGTEEKANWMWGDNGVGYFGRSQGIDGDTWTLDWQCY